MNKQRLLILSFWGGIWVLLFIGVALYFDLHKRNTLSDTPLVKVNESTLTAGDFSEQLARALEEYDSVMARDPSVVEFQKNRIVEAFIHKTLLVEWAKKNNVSVSKAEIEAEMNSIRSNYPDDISFKEALFRSRQSLSSWKETISDKLLQKKVFEILMKDVPAPTEDEMRSYYNQNKESFKFAAQVRLRQVVVADEDTAQRIYHSIDNKTKFEDLAKQFSISPDAKQGGDTGWLDEGSFEIFDKAFSMKVGQRSGVLKSPFGYHIFEVIGKKPAGSFTFEEVQKKIYRILQANKENALYSGWLEQQIRNARVFKNTDAIKAIQVTPSGD
jgi:peptidyl-prolyl cis-trans isomerase C